MDPKDQPAGAGKAIEAAADALGQRGSEEAAEDANEAQCRDGAALQRQLRDVAAVGEEIEAGGPLPV